MRKTADFNKYQIISEKGGWYLQIRRDLAEEER